MPKKRPRRNWFPSERHRYWRVTIDYGDGEEFARVYMNYERAVAFAERQKKSPAVKSATIVELE